MPLSRQGAIRSKDHEFLQPIPETEGSVSTSLELGDLECHQMVKIANSWRAHVREDKITKKRLQPLTEDQAHKLLRLMKGQQHLQHPERHPRKAWRPLFAMMIGQFITQFDEAGAFDDKINWQILDQVLQSEREEYWLGDDGKITEYPESVWNLACLATMIAHYDHKQALQVFPEIDTVPEFDHTHFFGPFNEAQFEAANTVLGCRVQPKFGTSGVLLLLGREPDLLGEFMVLHALTTHMAFDRSAAETRMATLITCALALSPDSFVHFMIRLSEDFGALDSVKALFAVTVPAFADAASAPVDLNEAAYYGFTGFVEAQIRAAANIDELHGSGATPLLFAAQEGHAPLPRP